MSAFLYQQLHLKSVLCAAHAWRPTVVLSQQRSRSAGMGLGATSKRGGRLARSSWGRSKVGTFGPEKRKIRKSFSYWRRREPLSSTRLRRRFPNDILTTFRKSSAFRWRSSRRVTPLGWTRKSDVKGATDVKICRFCRSSRSANKTFLAESLFGGESGASFFSARRLLLIRKTPIY